MIDAERQSRDALTRELIAAGATFRGSAIVCPFHSDQHPSGSMYEGDDQVWRYKCHGGECGFCGDIFDVRARAQGRRLDDVLREANPDPCRQRNHVSAEKTYATIQDLRSAVAKTGEIEAEYSYTDPDSRATNLLIFRVQTGSGKAFRQAHPTPGGWVQKAPAKPWPLYNRTRVRTAETVVVVEGEKVVHALHDVGVIATTAPCGAGKAPHADWSPLAGKALVLWPDNDKPGRDHMVDVAAIARGLNPVPHISLIEPNDLDLAEAEDAADLITQARIVGADPGQIVRGALAKAKPVDSLSAYHKRQAAILRGEMRCVPLPWPELNDLTRALLPGRLLILAGTKGAAKSFLLLQCVQYWLGLDVSVAVLVMEGDRGEYLDRALAQMTGNAEFTNPKWQEDHPREVRVATEQYAAELSRLSESVTRSPLGATLEWVAEWIEAQAKADKRIICIDPITMAMRTGKPWVSDKAFVDAAKHTAEAHGCSVALVSHMQKGAKEGETDALAGSACYERFADTIIQLHRHDARTSTVLKSCGRMQEEHDQTVFVEKARAPGTGYRLAYQFQTGKNPNDDGALSLRELGIIVRAEKG